jgi:hypothetical protein
MTTPSHAYSPKQGAQERSQYPQSSKYNTQSNKLLFERPATPLTSADANQVFSSSGVESIISSLHNASVHSTHSSASAPFSRVARLNTPPSNPSAARRSSGGATKIGRSIIPPDPTQLPKYLDTSSPSGQHFPSSPIVRPGTSNSSRPNTAAISAHGTDNTVTEPHMVRLTPIGKVGYCGWGKTNVYCLSHTALFP